MREKISLFVVRMSLVVMILLIVISCSKSQRIIFSGEVVNSEIVKPELQEKNLGTILFSISANAEVVDVSEFKIKITSIELGRVGGELVKINDLNSTFNLVELRNNLARKMIGQLRAEAGKYSKVKITYQLERKNYLSPTNVIELPLLVEVKKNSFSIVDFEFLIDSSLRKTLDGQQVFAPVVNLKLNSAKIVELSSDRTFSTENEVQTDKSKYGMNLNGVMIPGEGIWKETPLKINNNKIVQADVIPYFFDEKIRRLSEIKLSIGGEFLNPTKFSVKVNQTTKLVLSAVRDPYTISIEGQGIILSATPTENSEYIFMPKNKGSFIVKCISCSGKVVGQMDVE